MVVAACHKMTMLWIENGSAGTPLLSKAGYESGILVNSMPVHLVHKQRFRKEIQIVESRQSSLSLLLWNTLF